MNVSGKLIAVQRFTVHGSRLKKTEGGGELWGSSFEDLEVWKKSCRLSVRLYKLLRDCREKTVNCEP